MTMNSMNSNNSAKTKSRYVLWPKESIQLVAQQMGIDIAVTDEALLELSSDVSYRLRQLVDNAMKSMAHTKTTRLTTSHLRTAMEASHCHQVMGFEANDSPIDSVLVKEANVFVCEDPLIDLNEEVDNLFDKTVCDIKVFKRDIQLDLDWLPMRSTHTPNGDNELSEELMNYYRNVMTVLRALKPFSSTSPT